MNIRFGTEEARRFPHDDAFRVSAGCGGSRRPAWLRPSLASASLTALAAVLAFQLGSAVPAAAEEPGRDSTGLGILQPGYVDRGVQTTRIEKNVDALEQTEQRIETVEDELEHLREVLTETQEVVGGIDAGAADGDIRDMDEADAAHIDAKVVGILGYPLPDRLPTEDEFIVFRGDRWEYEVILWPPQDGKEPVLDGGSGVAWGGDWWGQLGINDEPQYGYYSSANLFNIQVNGEVIYHPQAFAGPGGSVNNNMVGVGNVFCMPGSCNMNSEQIWDTLNLFKAPAQMDFDGMFRQISAGTRHVCGIDLDDKAWCWGYGFSGRLGQGAANSEALANQQHGTAAFGNQHLSHSSFPVPVATDLRFTKIAAGHRHSCGIDTGGDMWCWGNNAHGEFGLGGDIAITVQCANGVSTPAGYEAYCPAYVYMTKQIVGSIGMPSAEQLTEVADPRYKVGGDLVPGPWVDVGAGEWFTCGLRVDGGLFCWGRGNDGALGFNPAGSSVSATVNYSYNNLWIGDSTGYKVASAWNRPYPTQVMPGTSFDSMTVGKRHVCAIEVAGQAWCWGWNQYGAVTGTGNPVMTPRAVGEPGRFKSISAGALHSCAIDQQDDAWCWGYGGAGRLGNGSTANQNEPVRVSGNVKFKAIATRASHTCGIDLDGQAWCWGDNTTGVVNPVDPYGEGWQTSYATPQRVAGTAGLTSIAVGPGFTVATQAE